MRPGGSGAPGGAGARVLFLAKHFPWPTNFGAKQRSFHILRGLAQTNEVVAVALDHAPAPEQRDSFLTLSGCTRIEFVSPDSCKGMRPRGTPPGLATRVFRAADALVRSPFPDMVEYWWSDALVDRLRRMRAEEPPFALVYASQSWMAEHARAAGYACVVVDLDDLLSVLSRQRLAAAGWYPRRPLDMLRAARERAYERSLPSRFTHVVVAKEEDRSFFPSSARERVSVLPNGITVPSAAAPQTDRADTILFVGTLEYPPNADAITYFATEVLPRIWSRRPETRFQVAGFGRGDHLRAVLADPRCAIAESPAELASFYAAASVVVAPVRIGGGTRIKVLEALAYGKPLVTTTFGAEGIPLRRGTEVEFADTSEEMAECCLRLFDDPGRCRALGEAGRAMVMKRFDWDRVVEQLDPLLRPLVV